MNVPDTIDLRLPPRRPRAWPHALAPARLDQLTHPTPFLICDGATLERRYEDLNWLLPGVRLYYAVKSNPMPQIVDTLAGMGCGFEIAGLSASKTWPRGCESTVLR